MNITSFVRRSKKKADEMRLDRVSPRLTNRSNTTNKSGKRPVSGNINPKLSI